MDTPTLGPRHVSHTGRVTAWTPCPSGICAACSPAAACLLAGPDLAGADTSWEHPFEELVISRVLPTAQRVAASRRWQLGALAMRILDKLPLSSSTWTHLARVIARPPCAHAARLTPRLDEPTRPALELLLTDCQPVGPPDASAHRPTPFARGRAQAA